MPRSPKGEYLYHLRYLNSFHNQDLLNFIFKGRMGPVIVSSHFPPQHVHLKSGNGLTLFSGLSGHRGPGAQHQNVARTCLKMLSARTEVGGAFRVILLSRRPGLAGCSVSGTPAGIRRDLSLVELTTWGTRGRGSREKRGYFVRP